MLDRTRTARLVATALALSSAACGGPAPDPAFADLDGVIRHPVPRAAAPAIELSVLLFITDDCPIANAYAPEIAAIVRDFADRPVRFFAVHVDPAITVEAAREHARAYGLPCPVLIDREHRLVRLTGATTTPEAAVLAVGGELLYRGRIDDCWADLGVRRHTPTTHDLRDALQSALAGRTVARPWQAAVGCYIPDREPR